MTGAIPINIPITTEMLHWGRRPTYEMVEQIVDGYPSDVSRWLIGAHTGTHVDAPSHFVPGGATVDEIALESVVGPVRVLEVEGCSVGLAPEAPELGTPSPETLGATTVRVSLHVDDPDAVAAVLLRLHALRTGV